MKLKNRILTLVLGLTAPLTGFSTAPAGMLPDERFAVGATDPEGETARRDLLTDDEITIPLTIGEFIALVMDRNHAMAAERLRAPIAEAELKAARVVPDPELSFEGAEELYSLELGYTIELGRKRGARIGYAKTVARMEKFETELFAAELRLEAAEAFIEAAAQAEILAVKNSSWEYMLELSRSDSIRFRAGEITENEARQSALEANTLLGEVYEQQGEYLASLALLGYYAGITADTLIVPAGGIRTDLDPAPLSRLVESGLANRVERELAAKNVELAQRELAVVRSERKPDVDVFIGYERDWKGFYSARHMLKGGMTIPLKFSSANKGALRAANMSVDRRHRSERDVQAMIEAEISQAYYLYRSALQAYGHFRSGIMEDARKVLEGAVYRYRAGETDILEVLIARRTYNETQEQYIDYRRAVRSAAVNLLHACGVKDTASGLAL